MLMYKFLLLHHPKLNFFSSKKSINLLKIHTKNKYIAESDAVRNIDTDSGMGRLEDSVNAGAYNATAI